ncbi:MAG: Ig-like domain-containing protein [Spirochaetes bacterium]|nr:Ig-like domain-containing protein [Spirochaetota bacterium]
MKQIQFACALFIISLLCIVSCKKESGDSPFALLAGALDAIAPTVVSTSPSDDAADVLTSTVIQVTFSEEMDAATITDSSFTVNDGSSDIGGDISTLGATATFTPDSPLSAGTVFTVTLDSAIRDLAGNPLGGDYTWSFSTRPEHGYLDTAFGTGGMATADINSCDETAWDAVLQSDGKVIVVGETEYAGGSCFALARFNTNGTLDTGFGTGGKIMTIIGTNSAARGVAIDGAGNIVVAGHSDGNFAVARYIPNGSLDSTFSMTTGIVTTDIDGLADMALDVAIQTDNKIVVAGYATIDGSPDEQDFAVVRYNANGTLDTAFSSDGIATTHVASNYEYAYSVAIQSDGKIIAAGKSPASGHDAFSLVRYNADGTVDTGFDTDGIVQTVLNSHDSLVSSVKILSSGRILVGGTVETSTNVYDFAMAEYNSSGSLYTTFGSSGTLISDLGTLSDMCNSLAVQSDNKIVLAGSMADGAGTDFALSRYSSTGSVDTTFGIDGIVRTQVGPGTSRIRAVLLTTDRIIAAGTASNGSNDDFAIVQYVQ